MYFSFVGDIMFAHNRQGQAKASEAYTQHDSPGGRTRG